MGGPALNPRMQRSPRLRSCQESAGMLTQVLAPARRPCSAAAAVNGGNLPIGRIHDQRRAPILHQGVSAVVPELVVGHDPALGCRRIDRPAHLRVDQVAVQAPVLARLEGRRLLGRQDRLAGQLGGAFHRRDRPEVPDALQIGIAPGHGRRGPGVRTPPIPVLAGAAGDGRQHDHGDKGARRRERSIASSHPSPVLRSSSSYADARPPPPGPQLP